MESKDAVDSALPKKRVNRLVAIPFTLWCALWISSDVYCYGYATWWLFKDLKWRSLSLLFSPCAWIWFSTPFAVWKLLSVWRLSIRAKYGDGEQSRTRNLVLVFFAPFAVALLLGSVGPYFFPATLGGADGRSFIPRFIPFVGGKGHV